MEKDDSPVGADALVARAMDRTLEAERAAQAAIAECERQSAEVLERARQQRRTVLERAQARIVALHTRAARNLARQAAPRSAAAAIDQLSDPSRRASALARLAARLTTDDAEADS
jgi:CRISPR type IV-associated protein Csf3